MLNLLNLDTPTHAHTHAQTTQYMQINVFSEYYISDEEENENAYLPVDVPQSIEIENANITDLNYKVSSIPPPHTRTPHPHPPPTSTPPHTRKIRGRRVGLLQNVYFKNYFNQFSVN